MRRLVTRFSNGFFRKRTVATTVAFILLAVYASFRVDAYSGGITGATQKNGSGCTCHDNNSNANTTVTITTSATTIEIGQSYTFTVTVSNSGKAGAGVNVAVDRGTLTAGAGLKKSGSELTHDPKKTSLPASWTFTYTAPNTAGEDKIYATGNAINNDGGASSADQWRHATTFVINVVEPPSRLIALSKTSMNLGNIRVGQNKQDTMRIFSQGDEALTITSSAPKNSSPFTSSPSGTNRSISTGSAEVNTITFAPTAKGTFVDTFVINNNSTVAANTRKTVILTGTGIQGAFSGATSMPFGDVKVNLTKKIGYVYMNNGDDTLFLSQQPSISGNGYTITKPANKLALAPNERDSVVIQLAPTAKQTYNGSLSFSAQGGVSVPTVSLAGNGVAPTIQNQALLNIGGIRVGLTNQSIVNFTNTGNDTLRVTAAQFTAGALNRFSISGSAVQAVLAGEQGSININHTPNDEIPDTVTLTIQSNALNTPTATMTIIGTGTMPRMLVAPGTKLEFGAVRTGKTASLSFQVQNPGTDILTLGAVSATAPFSLEAKSSSVEAKQNGTVTIKFAPTATGEFSGIVIVNGDDPANMSDTVIVTGTGVTSALSLASNLEFGSLPVGQESILNLTLSNEGTASVTIFNYKLNNNTHGSFRIVDSAAHTVAAGGTAIVKVGFKPMTAAAFTAQLAIAVDDNSAPTRTVALSGSGVQGQLQVTPTSIDFGIVDSGTTSLPKTVTLRNTGTAPVTITNFTSTCSAQEFTIGTIPNPVIAAGAQVEVTITYAPKNRGVDQCVASVTAEGNTLPVQIRGEGRGKDIPVESVHRNSPIADFKLKVAPNPVRGTAIVSMMLKRSADVQIDIYDMSGRAVARVSNGHMPVGENSVTLSTLGLTNGEYFLVATSEGQLAGEAKIIVQR